MINKASSLLSLQSVPCQMVNRNSSSKNPLTIGVETVRDQINSLVVGRDKILQAARATDVSIIHSRKQSNLYTTAVDVIPSNQISTRVSRTSMAEIMVNAWNVIKEIPSLSKYHGSKSIDIRSYIGSMETIQDLAEDSIEDAKKKKFILKSIKLPAIKAKRQYLKDGGTKPKNNRFSMCINCDHGLLDLPPMNNAIMLTEFKAGIQADPPHGKNGKAISKAPPLSTKQYIITCKCQNNKKDNCIVKCFYDG